MLHEVLFGLLGHGLFAGGDWAGGQCGDSSVKYGSRHGGSLRVSGLRELRASDPAVPAYLIPRVLSEAEAALVENLMVVGKNYVRLQIFVANNARRPEARASVAATNSLSSTGEDVSTCERQSLVRRALCRGIQTRVLEPHVKIVCEIEKLVLQQPVFPLSRIKAMVKESASLLAAVVELCGDIADRKLVGGQVIEILYRKLAQCGVPALRAVLEALLHRCASVVLNMAQAWMTHGILADPAAEFFVQERPYKVRSPHQLLEEQKKDENRPMAFAGTENVSSMSRGNWIAEYEWRSQIRLRESMLPSSLFGLELAQRVIFAGKAARVLQRYYNSSLLSQAQGDDESPVLITDPSEPFAKAAAKIVQAIERHSHLVAARLHTLIVKDSKLLDHVQFMREFFLLGRGGFYTSFLQLGRPLFSQPPRPTLEKAQIAVNSGPWREAAVQSGIDIWPAFTSSSFDKLGLVLRRPSVEFKSFDFNGQESGNVSENEGKGVPVTRRSSTLSDLAFVGQVAARNKGIEIDRRGGMWHVEKIVVEDGFTSFVRFSSAKLVEAAARGLTKKQGQDSLRVGICVQYDNFVGPTAMGLQGDSPWSGLRNNIAFAAQYSHDLETVRLVLELSDGRILSASEPAFLPSSLHNFQHTLHVEYGFETQFDEVGEKSSISSKSIASARTSSIYVVRLKLLDEANHVKAALKTRLDLFTKRVATELGSGRAWVGVLAARAPCSNPVNVSQWTFSPRQRSGGYDNNRDSVNVEDQWRSLLSLRVQVEWPLHLVFTQSCLDKYNMLFQFLLGLQRVTAELNSAWALLNQTRFKRPPAGKKNSVMQNRRLMLMWRLRSSMAFLVSNLQFHVQVDNIDALHKQLAKDVASANDFSFVEKAHERFLSRLISATYLHQRQIRVAIQRLLARCLQFCGLITRFDRVWDSAQEGSDILRDLDGRLGSLGSEFRKESTFLHTVLGQYNSHLLLRVDYNGHLSKLAQRKASYKL